MEVQVLLSFVGRDVAQKPGIQHHTILGSIWHMISEKSKFATHGAGLRNAVSKQAVIPRTVVSIAETPDGFSNLVAVIGVKNKMRPCMFQWNHTEELTGLRSPGLGK